MSIKQGQTRIWELLLVIAGLMLLLSACGEASGTVSAPPSPTSEAQVTLPTETPKATEPLATPIPTVPRPPASARMACFGTSGFGITCLDETGWQSFTKDGSPLGCDVVHAMAVCPDNRILIAHTLGISAFDGETWTEYHLGFGMSTAEAVACDAAGGIWVAHLGGVSYFDGTNWTTHPTEKLAIGEAITNFAADVAIASDGQVWVVTLNSVAVFNGSDWTVFQEEHWFDKPYTFDRRIVVDGHGRPWAAHGNGLLMFDGTTWTAYNNSDLVGVESLAVDAEGRVWIGTRERGVSVFDGHSWVTYDTENSGLSSNHVHSIMTDAQGRMWLGTEWGLSIFDGTNWQSYHMHTADLADNDIHGLAVIGAGPSLPEPMEKAPGALMGRIVRRGYPVVNSTVEICVERPSAYFSGPTLCSDQPFARQAITDGNGHFTISGLPVGRYFITFNTAEGEWDQLKSSSGFVERVTVEADQVTRLAELDLDPTATPPPTPEPTPTAVVIVEGKVIVATDRTEYEQGETVGISVTNNLNRPLWYAQEVECGLSFWLLESCEKKEIIYYKVPCVWAEPQHRFTKLNPGETLRDEWNGTLEVLRESGLAEELAEPGCYRLRLPFSLEEKKAIWEGDKIEVYSNEFVIR
jgi:hypothetical protein